MLQSRYWKQRFKNCDRSRWIESCGGKEKIRLQKRRISNKIRVESIQNEKSGSDRSVYNLQIQGHPSFYAGGVLVHNCHMINTIDDSMYRSFLSEVGQAYVGLTATPYRLSTGLIYGKDNTLFDDLVYDLTSLSNFNKLIAEGYLCNLKTMQTQLEFDTSLLHHRGGEFIESEMSDIYNQAEITKLAIKEIVKVGTEHNYKKWLIFAIDIAHAESIAEELMRLNIPTGVVHSKMEDEKVVVLEKHKTNKFRALVNVNMLTTGYNDEQIDLIGMLRPTESPVLHVQTVGRGTRVSPGKDHCMILDFAGNTKRLGPINNITIKEHYKLKEGTGTPITKTCPECSLIVPPALNVCECGYIFQFKTKLETESTGYEIIATDMVWYDVEKVIYELYKVPSNIYTIKATYVCMSGFKRFSELFCLNHDGYARSRAVSILLTRGANKADLGDCAAAFKIIDTLTKPKRILINNSKKFAEIKRYKY
jgi:DNA repair protein RadD